MTKHDEYRGTTRTLEVLRSLNESNGATVSQLSRATGISRTALYRILGALVDAGYIRRRDDTGTFFLTNLIQSLSDGFKDEYWVAEIAGPVLDDLQRRVIWPTDLGVCRNYEIQLTSTTRRYSPLVIDRSSVGDKMPLLRTALGLGYLAYAWAPERETLLDYLAKSGKAHDSELASDRRSLNALLRDVRKRGYACQFRNIVAHHRYPDISPDSGTIAVPILLDGHSVASLGITFIASALSVQQAVDRHLKDLKDAAATVERALIARAPKPALPT